MTARKRVTLQDIARACGISVSAVSMILNDRADVSFTQATSQKVRQAAAVLGYQAPKRHRGPLRCLRQTVLVAAPNVSNGYYTAMLQAVQQAASDKDFSILIFNTYRDPAREVELLSTAEAIGAAGVIFCMMPADTALVERVNLTLPIVVVGDRRENLNVDTVEIDNYRAGLLVGRHLFELGHRHLAFVSTTLNASNAQRQRRLKGLRDASAEAGPECSVSVLSQDVTPEQELNETDLEYRVGHDLTRRLIRRRTPVTGIVTVNDSVAYGVLDALNEAGLSVPGDCSVCGFDNLGTSRTRGLRLTTVDHQIEQRGRGAFMVLHERLTGARESGSITRVEFSHYLVRGLTSGPVPQRDKAPAGGDDAV